MKKMVLLLLVFVFAFSLVGCGGDVSNAKIDYGNSRKYSKKEIASAIDTIKDEFKKEWSGCTLTKIYYAGDDISAQYQDWADRNNADEVIVLLSSFDVDSSGGDGSLNPNGTYDNWNWILVRSGNGKWKHVDHGY